jgi:hypothetical protein
MHRRYSYTPSTATILNQSVNPSTTDLGTSTACASVNEVEKDEKHSSINEKEEYEPRTVEDLGDLVSQVDEKPSYEDPDGKLVHRGKQRMVFSKGFFWFCIFGFK